MNVYKVNLAMHCHREHGLKFPFIPARGVTWDMVHHLLHRLNKWGKP